MVLSNGVQNWVKSMYYKNRCAFRRSLQKTAFWFTRAAFLKESYNELFETVGSTSRMDMHEALVKAFSDGDLYEQMQRRFGPVTLRSA